MQLSKYFTLEDLTTTSHRGVNNQPDVMSLENLKRLAHLLDLIYDHVGPFRVTSAYRSPELNKVLAGSNPVSTTSYHMRGLAADLWPEDDSAFNFFVKILNSDIYPLLGELINEADEQGIVHVSLPTPDKTMVAMYLKHGNYYRYSPSEIEDLKSGRNIKGQSQVVEYSDFSDNSSSLSTTAMAAIAASMFLVVSIVLSRRTA